MSALLLRFAFHAILAPNGRTVGLLVWDDDTIAYFPVRGEGAGPGESIAGALARGISAREIMEYYLDRGGGGYQSISIPEEIDAESMREAAHTIGRANEFDLVVPLSRRESSSFDAVIAHEMIRATRSGAKLIITEEFGRISTDLAFKLGFGHGPQPLFAWIPVGWTPMEASGVRVQVDCVEREGTGETWLVFGRAKGGEIIHIEVSPVDPRTDLEISAWREQSGAELLGVLDREFAVLLDPSVLG